MKSARSAGSSGLFLIELIFAILFFSVAAAICVRFFADARQMNDRAVHLNQGVNETCAVAEVLSGISSYDQLEPLIRELYPDAVLNDGRITFSDVLYSELEVQSHMLTARLYYLDDTGEPIYELTVKHYLKEDTL